MLFLYIIPFGFIILLQFCQYKNNDKINLENFHGHDKTYIGNGIILK